MTTSKLPSLTGLAAILHFPPFIARFSKSDLETDAALEKGVVALLSVLKELFFMVLAGCDSRPIWIQVRGGTNAIARCLKTFEEEHLERMREMAFIKN